MRQAFNLQAPFVLTLDIGSSSVRAMIFDARARVIPDASAQVKYNFHTTSDGGVEMDADELFEHCLRAIDEVLAHIGEGVKPIAAVASDCFAMSILGVDADGNAVTPIYTYADSRGARAVGVLRAQFDERAVHQRVGTLFHTSYLPARIAWLARERVENFERARYWMSFGEYFNFKLLRVRACSHSIASWTGLLNRETLDWDDELLAALPITRELLSPIVNCELRVGELRNEFTTRWSALKGAAWFPTIGDGAAANVGSGCVNTSRVALTVGTSSAMRVAADLASLSHSLKGKGGDATLLLPNRERDGVRVEIPRGLWSYRITRDLELIGGALSEGGNVFAWMQNVLQLDNEDQIERELAAMQPDAHRLTVLPFLAGERAPNWNADARGAVLGLGLNTHPIEILRAGMEAVAYRLGLVYELLRGVAPNAREIIASGGALERSPTWVQMIADVLNARVIASAEAEATSRGAALVALKALGALQSFDELPAQMGRAYQPDASRHEIYARASERQKKWYNLMLKESDEKE